MIPLTQGYRIVELGILSSVFALIIYIDVVGTVGRFGIRSIKTGT